MSVRSEVAKRGRRGDSHRAISDFLVSEGYGIGREGVAGHLKHSGIEHGSSADPRLASVLLASIAAEVLSGWPHQAQRIATRAQEAGLCDEAQILTGTLPESMRTPLPATGIEASSPAAELLAGRLLAKALGRVLSDHTDAARALADELHALDASELAESVEYLANTPAAQRVAT